MMLVILASCSKTDDDPVPSAIIPPGDGVATVTCSNSTWKYEVMLSSPVDTGSFTIKYKDEFDVYATDTTLTGQWSYEFTMQHPGSPVGEFLLETYIYAGPSAPGGSSFQNDIQINIYQNGNLVSTTGGFVPFCNDDLAVGCQPNAVHNVSIYYQCN